MMVRVEKDSSGSRSVVADSPFERDALIVSELPLCWISETNDKMHVPDLVLHIVRTCNKEQILALIRELKCDGPYHEQFVSDVSVQSGIPVECIVDLYRISTFHGIGAFRNVRGERHLVGKGIYAHLSFLNHSCEPNSRLQIADIQSGRQALYATKNIEKGEEIVIDYFANSVLCLSLLDVESRQKLISTYCNFDCTCMKCIADKLSRSVV